MNIGSLRHISNKNIELSVSSEQNIEQKIDDIHYHWKRSDREAFPKLFYGIAMFEDEKDDIQRKFDQLAKNQSSQCKPDELLQFGTKETNSYMKQLANSYGKHLFIEKDFFHFSPQVRYSHDLNHIYKAYDVFLF